MSEENSHTLTGINPPVKRIVFYDSSPEVSDEAFVLFCHATNKRRPYCSSDSKSQHFIADMNSKF